MSRNGRCFPLGGIFHEERYFLLSFVPPLICLQAKENSAPLRKFCPVENGPNRLDKKYKNVSAPASYFGYIKLYPSHFYLKFVSFRKWC